jgi:hypothetical protein
VIFDERCVGILCHVDNVLGWLMFEYKTRRDEKILNSSCKIAV